MFVPLRLVAWGVLLLGGCSQASLETQSMVIPASDDAQPGAPSNDGKASYRLDLVRQIDKDKLKIHRISVANDPVSGPDPKSYDAYELMDVLKLIPEFSSVSEGKSKEDYALTFVAADRFRVTIPLSQVVERKAWLAFREVDRDDGADWGTVPGAKEAVTPAPYYLLWENQKPNEWTAPNPYQILFLILERFDQVYAAAVPKQAAAQEGFRQFASVCIWCHSVNYVGGRSAHELNVPVNYTQNTETSSKEDFLKRLSGPGFCDLYGPVLGIDRGAIWDYLASMKEQKICTTADQCKQKDPL
jgi:mono/diheme cytochrome c family protein